MINTKQAVTPKVLIADSISQRGVDELARENALEVTIKTGLNERELVALIPEFSALVVRSQTKVTAEILNAGRKLRVVGRAGVGVDNVDVEAATQRGVVVMNTPGGSSTTVAELAPKVKEFLQGYESLDDDTREEMYALLESVQSYTGVTTLHVTHHLGEAERLADVILVLQDGRIQPKQGANSAPPEK